MSAEPKVPDEVPAKNIDVASDFQVLPDEL